ncbi:hypothetical protein Tco_0562391 [Tanacetum coccineum]
MLAVVAADQIARCYNRDLSRDLEAAFEYPGEFHSRGHLTGIPCLNRDVVANGLASRKVTLRVSMAWAKGVTTGTLCALSLDKLAMPPHFHKKFRIGVAIERGCRGYYKPGIRAWVNRGSRKIRIARFTKYPVHSLREDDHKN